MEPIDCPETSLRNYHYWLRNNPEECSSQLLHGGSLKSRTIYLLLAVVFAGVPVRFVSTDIVMACRAY